MQMQGTFVLPPCSLAPALTLSRTPSIGHLFVARERYRHPSFCGTNTMAMGASERYEVLHSQPHLR